MRPLIVCGCALSLAALLGCPEFHGRGGRIDHASHKDALELLPEQCSPVRYREICIGPKRNAKKCQEECGE